MAGTADRQLVAIVASAAGGDEIAFERIVAAYHDDLYRVCAYVTGDVDLAEDAVQSAWAIAWQKLASLRQPDRVRSWLMRVAVNEAKRLLAAAVVRSIATTTLRRRWSITTRFRTHPDGGTTMFAALKLIAAGVVMALFGGFLLGGALTTQPADEAVPAAATLDTSEPWDLVWYSDSGGWYVADLWAETIEAELGVEVRVHDHSAGGLSAVEVLESLGEPTEGYTRLGDTRDDVAEAEIVVVYGNPEGSGARDDLRTCVSTSTVPRDPPSRYAAEDFDPYRDVLESIYERVFTLVGDRPVIVRAIDLYNPVIADWRLAGIEEECTAAWEAWSDTIRDAAAAFDVPLVSMYDVFNGPDHSEDPREKGYIISDGEHTMPAAREAMVAALHEAGYEPIEP